METALWHRWAAKPLQFGHVISFIVRGHRSFILGPKNKKSATFRQVFLVGVYDYCGDDGDDDGGGDDDDNDDEDDDHDYPMLSRNKQLSYSDKHQNHLSFLWRKVGKGEDQGSSLGAALLLRWSNTWQLRTVSG